MIDIKETSGPLKEVTIGDKTFICTADCERDLQGASDTLKKDQELHKLLIELTEKYSERSFPAHVQKAQSLACLFINEYPREADKLIQFAKMDTGSIDIMSIATHYIFCKAFGSLHPESQNFGFRQPLSLHLLHIVCDFGGGFYGCDYSDIFNHMLQGCEFAEKRIRLPHQQDDSPSLYGANDFVDLFMEASFEMFGPLMVMQDRIGICIIAGDSIYACNRTITGLPQSPEVTRGIVQ